MNRSMKQMLSMLLVVAMMAAMLVIPSAAAAKTEQVGDATYTLGNDVAISVDVDDTYNVSLDASYVVAGDTTVYGVDKDTVYVTVADTAVVDVTYTVGADAINFAVKGLKAGTTTVTVKLTNTGLQSVITVTVAAEPTPTPSTEPSTTPSAAPSTAPSAQPSAAPAPEAKTMEAGKTYVMDAGKIFDATKDNAAWRSATAQAGKDNRFDITQDAKLLVEDVFTVYAKTNASGSTPGYMETGDQAFDDGYTGTANISFGDKARFLNADGSSAGDVPNAVIGFTTADKATVKVWWKGGGSSSNRTVGIVQPDATVVSGDNIGAKVLAEGTIWTADSKAMVESFELDAAGTYYVGNVRNGNRIYKVEVTVASAAVEPSTAPSTTPSEKPSEAPMTVYTVKADAEVSVRVNGTKTVKVTTEPANGEVYVVSADAKIVTATVADNVLTLKGVKKGTTTVVLGVKDGEGTASVKVTVTSSTGGFGGAGGGSSSTTKPAGDYTAKKTTDRNGNVTITVTDKNGEVVAKVEIPATIPTLETKFVDVPDDHWAAKSINALAALGMVKGVNEAEHLYDMNSNVTRGSLATILFRLAQAKGATSDFTDVAKDAWYADAVGWAAKVGIIAGKGDNTFGADESITREQLALMLYRFAKLLGVDTRATGDVAKFADGANTSDWAAEAMTWAVGAGILVGNTANELNPTAAASRAETACMVDRFISLLK